MVDGVIWWSKSSLRSFWGIYKTSARIDTSLWYRVVWKSHRNVWGKLIVTHNERRWIWGSCEVLPWMLCASWPEQTEEVVWGWSSLMVFFQLFLSRTDGGVLVDWLCRETYFLWWKRFITVISGNDLRPVTTELLSFNTIWTRHGVQKEEVFMILC